MGVSASATRSVVAILLLSSISTLVLADDAGSGSDAGGSSSTATSLSPTNATYYGNLSSTDMLKAAAAMVRPVKQISLNKLCRSFGTKMRFDEAIINANVQVE